MDNNMISITVRDGDFDALYRQLRTLHIAVNDAAKIALPKIGDDVLAIVRRTGPRSVIHRGPGKLRQKWRNPVVHALDTIRVSPVRTGTNGGKYIIVGPARNDNSPSFYLKFFEYGTARANFNGSPFLRPARDAVMRGSAVQTAIDAINAKLARGVWK